MLPDSLASVIALLGFVAVLIMAFGDRRKGDWGIVGAAVFTVASLLILVMIVTR